MKKNIFIPSILFLFVLLCLVGFYPYASFSYVIETVDEDETEEIEEIEEINVEDSIEFFSSSEMRDKINFNIFEDIERAKRLLDDEHCDFNVVKLKQVVRTKKVGKTKTVAKTKKAPKAKKGVKSKKASKQKTIERSELGEFNIILAIEDIKTREIKIVKVHPKFGTRSEGVIIEPGKPNGVNTKFTIVYPEQHIVLAIKRPVRSGNSFKEASYTPYSENLDIPEIREAGLEYLRNTLGTAKRDLLDRGVKPISCNEFVADDVSVALAIIEHIDPQKFQSGRYTTEKLINETLVVMGTNKQNAYRYSVSKAGARGLFQFIPDTYKRIVRRYPKAGLNLDFIKGMEDHINAAKASFLLFDADMRALNNGRDEQLMNSPEVLGRFLASAYNCGAGKTKNAMDRYGKNWTSRVPLETQIYLNKYDAVWDWLQLLSKDKI